jgi:hypothetical protein
MTTGTGEASRTFSSKILSVAPHLFPCERHQPRLEVPHDLLPVHVQEAATWHHLGGPHSVDPCPDVSAPQAHQRERLHGQRFALLFGQCLKGAAQEFLHMWFQAPSSKVGFHDKSSEREKRKGKNKADRGNTYSAKYNQMRTKAQAGVNGRSSIIESKDTRQLKLQRKEDSSSDI